MQPTSSTSSSSIGSTSSSSASAATASAATANPISSVATQSFATIQSDRKNIESKPIEASKLHIDPKILELLKKEIKISLTPEAILEVLERHVGSNHDQIVLAIYHLSKNTLPEFEAKCNQVLLKLVAKRFSEKPTTTDSIKRKCEDINRSNSAAESDSIKRKREDKNRSNAEIVKFARTNKLNEVNLLMMFREFKDDSDLFLSMIPMFFGKEDHLKVTKFYRERFFASGGNLEEAFKSSKLAKTILKSTEKDEKVSASSKVTITEIKVQPLSSIRKPSSTSSSSSSSMQTEFLNNYEFSEYRGITLTGASVRPADLFLQAIFGENTFTPPGFKGFFKFNNPDERTALLMTMPDDTVFKFSAKNKKGTIHSVNDCEYVPEGDLTELYGSNEIEISKKELIATLEDVQIYTSSDLPLQFLCGFKKAIKKDHPFDTLPRAGANPILLSDLRSIQFPETTKFLSRVEQSFKISETEKNKTNEFGFENQDSFKSLLNSTLYQIGSMVVRSSPYRLFVDGSMKLRTRKAGANDALKQIDVATIRELDSPKSPKNNTQNIVKRTFITAFAAAGSGYIFFPTISAVWTYLYWKAFIEVVIEIGEPFKTIYVNPFEDPINPMNIDLRLTLVTYKSVLSKSNPKGLANLEKVQLFDTKMDILQHAHDQKKCYPTETVSIVNITDPDVTLGTCTGMHVLKQPAGSGSDENYAAAGTTLLTHLKKEISSIDSTKMFQVSAEKGKVTLTSKAQLEAAKK